MKRLTLTFILSLCCLSIAFAVTKSQVVVYINGERYYIHTVESQETLYSISKAYQVPIQTIIDLNSDQLKAGENIKIPYKIEPTVDKEKSGLRSLFTFSKHTIKKGETLYSISRQYEISIETIMEDNPEVDPIALSTGDKLLIRKKMIGKSSEEQSLAEWDEYREDLNLTTQMDGYTYHIVEKGETIYSLSKKAEISEEDFIELNNLSGGLKAGSIIKYPAQTTQDIEDQATSDEFKQISLRSLKQTDTLKIALFLPLSNGEKVQRQFADFYNGFVEGLDDVKERWRREIELTLYNTERNIDTVIQIIESEEFDGTNLIVGPIYEELLAPVVTYAEHKQIPVVSPLAAIKEVNSSVLFQLAPPVESRYDKVKPMVADTKHVTLIYTDQIDSTFEANVKKILAERPYDTHKYVYEHPTIVAEKMRDGKESTGDLSKFINNEKDNTIVVMSSSETDVDRILSALSSAQINIVARGGKAPRYEVLGNSEWSRYRNIDRTILFKNNVVLLSSYHAKRDNVAIKIFDSNFIKKYGALPSIYAYRGYDAAMIFGEGIYSDMDYNLEGRSFAPLQSHYKFQTDPQSGVHTNTEWIKVNYKNNYTITIE